MNYNSDIFMFQFPIVKTFAYHITYFRVLRAIYEKYDLKSEFWKYSIDAHLLQATLNWCMVFGTDGCNQTHWKNLEVNATDQLKKSFRNGLIAHVGINSSQWEKYWTKMKDFRNKYAAHRDN